MRRADAVGGLKSDAADTGATDTGNNGSWVQPEVMSRWNATMDDVTDVTQARAGAAAFLPLRRREASPVQGRE
ncbi:MAG: hypothetical protein LBK99_20895 [Opitutaceae bacterium]|jgi:hypothetical protein|nr:hypothetical protein [Opitutaceae bacterium]